MLRTPITALQESASVRVGCRRKLQARGRVVCWALLCALAPALTAQAEPPLDLDGLLGAFARMPGLEARFVEEKHIGLLAQPLESRGRLYFTHPGLLLRRVESPRVSEVVITTTTLRIKDDNGEQNIDLRARPDIKPFVESLTWLLAGNRKALAEVYALEFKPSGPGLAANWQLTLTPKREPLTHLIAFIRVVGSGRSVSEVQVREKSGDETVTRIVEANPARHFDAQEKQRLFGVVEASVRR